MGGPTELIPTRQQIVEVREVLLSRRDQAAAPVQQIIALVDDYLSGG